MAVNLCVIYHSGFGHTAKQAAAVIEGVRSVAGVECLDIPVEHLDDADGETWARIDAADAMIFGCPTYMGSPSAGIKKFMEMTSSRWMEQRWADKVAAGFTNSGSHNGDKQNKLVGLATFAAQAALVTLGLRNHRYFPKLQSILIYPGAFRDHGRRRFDLHQDDDRGVLYGESWDTGSVILSWDNVVAGGRNADDGMNVVIHEFAHQLDQYNGIADGVPQLASRDDYARWAAVMGPHYEALVDACADVAGA